jgi:hypothetical protein
VIPKKAFAPAFLVIPIASEGIQITWNAKRIAKNGFPIASEGVGKASAAMPMTNIAIRITPIC